MKTKTNTEKGIESPLHKHGDLVETVRAAIGDETLDALAKQPLAIAGGGVEALLQEACTRCAGHPQAAESAVRTLRTLCGSSAEPKPEKMEAP